MTQMTDELKRTLNILTDGETELDNILQDQVSASDLGVEEQEPRPARVLELKLVDSEVPDLAGTDAQVDYIYARNMTYTLLDKVGNALQGALEIAIETEHPRAYGITNELATTMRELTKDLISLQKTYKEVTKDRKEMEPPPVTSSTTNNTQVNVVGSSTDILKLIEQANAAKRDPIYTQHETKDMGAAEVVEKEVTDGTSG